MNIASSTAFMHTGFTAWPVDWIVIVGLVALAAFSTIRSGTSRATALALAFPFAALLYSEVPGAFVLGDAVGHLTNTTIQAVVFAVILILVLLALMRITSSYDSLTGGSLLGVLSGLAVGILLIVTWLQVPALGALHPLSNPLPMIFAETYRFWWTLAALGILAFVRS